MVARTIILSNQEFVIAGPIYGKKMVPYMAMLVLYMAMLVLYMAVLVPYMAMLVLYFDMLVLFIAIYGISILPFIGQDFCQTRTCSSSGPFFGKVLVPCIRC